MLRGVCGHSHHCESAVLEFLEKEGVLLRRTLLAPETSGVEVELACYAITLAGPESGGVTHALNKTNGKEDLYDFRYHMEVEVDH